MGEHAHDDDLAHRGPRDVRQPVRRGDRDQQGPVAGPLRPLRSRRRDGRRDHAGPRGLRLQRDGLLGQDGPVLEQRQQLDDGHQHRSEDAHADRLRKHLHGGRRVRPLEPHLLGKRRRHRWQAARTAHVGPRRSCTWVRIDRLTARVDDTTVNHGAGPAHRRPGRPDARRPRLLGDHAEPGRRDDVRGRLPAEVQRPHGHPEPQVRPGGLLHLRRQGPSGNLGRLYIFDPGFCEGTLTTGLGDYWYDTTYGAVDAYFDLFQEVNNTPYDPLDDPLVWSSRTAGLFQNSRGSDPDLGSAPTRAASPTAMPTISAGTRFR